MAELGWSLNAESDLHGIEEFIARDSSLHAVALVDRLIESTEQQLGATPRVGRVVPEFGREDLREIVFRG